MLNILAIGTIAALGMTVAASSAPAVAAEPEDIVDTAVAAGSFNTLAKALAAAVLIESLGGAGPSNAPVAVARRCRR